MAPSRLRKFLPVLYIVALLFNSQAAALHSVTHIPVPPLASGELYACDSGHGNEQTHAHDSLQAVDTSHGQRTPCQPGVSNAHDASHPYEASHTHKVLHAHDIQHVQHIAHINADQINFKSPQIVTVSETTDPHRSEEGYLCHECCLLAKPATLQAHQIPAAAVTPALQVIDFTSHNHAASLSVQAICIRGSPKVI